ncbi:MAG TPA: crossover junction endodeoxyribonuclease RuvC [Candidatus Bathyarchaeia archaeon]|nr:crossover junction endodeoxyribonuclease RuvC [Candidatus Bathyarchaeia archaeon]
MIVLGVDPGIALTGWGVLKKEDEPELLAYGCIKTSKNNELQARLLQIFCEFQDIVKKFKPEIICLEKLFFNTNAKTAFSIGEARGVIKICAALNKIKIAEFTPLQIKNTIVGYGRAEKIQVQQMVKVLLKLDEIPQPDDAADGIATALTYCSFNRSLVK